MTIQKKYSIIFSVFNEQSSLPFLFKELLWLDMRNLSGEILFVNDGSQDNSQELIESFSNTNQLNNFEIRYLSFSRNFGHEAAMIAGIDHANCDAAICLDADLQHPIRLIPEIVETFEAGYDIVMMKRVVNKQNSSVHQFLVKSFYSLFNRISSVKIQPNVSDFFLISKNVIKVLKNSYRDKHRFARGIIQNIGFRSTTLEYSAPERIAGDTKYSIIKLVIHTLNALVSFSKKPLFWGIYVGFFFALLAIILAVYTLVVYLFGSTPPSGYTTIVLFSSFSFSILFFLIGIIGIYVGYVFDELKNRPIYIVSETNITKD